MASAHACGAAARPAIAVNIFSGLERLPQMQVRPGHDPRPASAPADRALVICFQVRASMERTDGGGEAVGGDVAMAAAGGGRPTPAGCGDGRWQWRLQATMVAGCGSGANGSVWQRCQPAACHASRAARAAAARGGGPEAGPGGYRVVSYRISQESRYACGATERDTAGSQGSWGMMAEDKT